MGISSTLNLHAWESEFNNEKTSKRLAKTIAKYCHSLRGITAYPDGARGGQPLTDVSYEEAKQNIGTIFDENEERCKGGVCGI